MTRSAAIALAALLGATPAAAQFRPTPMRVPAAAGSDLLTGRFSGAATPGELATVDPATGTVLLRPHGALLAPATYAGLIPAGAPVAAGRTRANGADLLTDVAYPEGSAVVIRSGGTGSAVSRPGGPTGPIAFAHVLPHDGDLLAFTNPTVGSGTGFLEIWDLDTSAIGGSALAQSWRADGLGPLAATEHVPSGLRLSSAALALGVDDLALPTQGGVFLLAHRPSTQDLRYAAPPAFPWEVRFAEVRVGGPSALDRPPWLPATIAQKGDALGAAALDLDQDGAPDLLFAYGSALDVPDGQGGVLPNHLVAVSGTGDPLDLAAGAWRDVTGDARLGLRDPVTLRQVDLAGVPAVALWDRALDEVVVLRVEGGTLRVWRGDAAGRRVKDLQVADVVGSAAPDLLAAAEDDVLVYPDLGDASPALAWAAGSPGAAVRGRDLALSVTAGDADGDLDVEWFIGDAWAAPLRAVAVAAGPASAQPYAYPGALLCDPLPQTLDVTVRATDALGVYSEVAAHLEVAFPAPALALASGSGGRLALPPGGTTAVLEGTSDAGCGATTFAWGGTLFDAAPSFVEEGTATLARRTVAVSEAIYPALLSAADPTVTLAARDAGAQSPPATLALDLDASGLVEVVHSADVAALAPGEVALLRTAVRSRLGVALPGVRVVDLLGGLLPAGAPRASGAAIAATARGGAEVVLDALPGGGAEVVIELPVRSAGGRGGSAVEVRSSGGHLLTPPAAGVGDGGELPGCGCGGGAASGEALLALAALAVLRRRRRAT